MPIESLAAMTHRPQLLYYGDDFTGATDTLASAARAGLRSILLFAPPDAARLATLGALDCLGIAGVSRSLAPARMREELAPIAELARELRPTVLHYKTCSTFDSAPEVGSIGEAVRTLSPSMPSPWVAIVGGQPNLGRYCLFGNLFATAGAGGEVVRIDRHPTMRRHPVTPMHEADLRRHLAQQGLSDIGLVPWTCYAMPPAEGGGETAAPNAVSVRVEALRAEGMVNILWDVARPGDLPQIGAQLWDAARRAPLLAVGPSSVTQALASAMAHGGGVSGDDVPAAKGPVLALAGSLSPVTAAQVAAAVSFEVVRLDAARLIEPDGRYCREAAGQLAGHLRAGRHTLACTVPSSALSTEASTQDRGVPALVLAQAGGRLLRRVLDEMPVSRMAIAGGDTSSHGVRALDAWGLAYAGMVSPGAPLCRLRSDAPALDGMEILLKGGQMGGVDVFERLVHGTSSRAAPLSS
ncbi:four-carbon acid sugar kinase family protein [Pandoraea terrigena]|uniref:Lipoprotein n=1 Tax=Pandoraea terrigena TaxID=2508292 RepID=A0A5E4Y0A4_9BURK|nr:four-carbon acid sugar kinase family protein [Pandoraea terrigena]VVE42056.1 lipoprotein [Pandoraea terrigena]